MRFWFISLFLIIPALAGCASVSRQEPPGESSPLPDLGPAPEWTNDVWLNTDNPLRLADLRGKVVLLDMWTFG